MSKYTHKIGSIKNYIQQIYTDGLKKRFLKNHFYMTLTIFLKIGGLWKFLL